MQPLELTATLSAFEGRGPGTDAERRAARWLSRELKAAGYQTRTEPFWCRPNWALAHAWHVALALAGSLMSVSHPTIGIVLLAAGLLSVLADVTLGISPGRRLTPEHASQNVIASSNLDKPARLIVTANYDAGRTALVYRDEFRRTAASLKRATGPLALGWLGWLTLAIVWLLAIAVIRTAVYNPPHILGVLQFPPSVALVLTLALLLEAAAASFGPAADDNASGTAVAIAVAHALQSSPRRNLEVELVLQGAGEGQEIGLRRYLRAHRQSGTIVLGIAPCGAGHPHWWRSDGRLIPLRYTRRLRDLAAEVAVERASPHRGRGGTPALPARFRRLPAIAIGCLDARGLAEASHQRTDTADRIQPDALDEAVKFALLLVYAIDDELDPAHSAPAATPA